MAATPRSAKKTGVSVESSAEIFDTCAPPCIVRFHLFFRFLVKKEKTAKNQEAVPLDFHDAVFSVYPFSLGL
jgi:hypothetical protein